LRLDALASSRVGELLVQGGFPEILKSTCSTLVTMLPRLLVAVLSLLCFADLGFAQFQFFDNFFGGQQQQQQSQEKQNVASDSAWYRQTWESGRHLTILLSSQHIIALL